MIHVLPPISSLSPLRLGCISIEEADEEILHDEEDDEDNDYLAEHFDGGDNDEGDNDDGDGAEASYE